MSVRHLSTHEIAAGLDEIKQSPKDDGVLHLIVRRPQIGAREVLAEAELDTAAGLVGDSWSQRKSSRTADGSPHPDMQLNVINSRTIALLAQTEERWPLAGDQLFIDLDLSEHNLRPAHNSRLERPSSRSPASRTPVAENSWSDSVPTRCNLSIRRLAGACGCAA